jgi:hypothetical protein
VNAAIGVFKGRFDRVPAEQKGVFAGAPFAALLWPAARPSRSLAGRPLLPALAAGLFCTSFLVTHWRLLSRGWGFGNFARRPPPDTA